MKRYFVLVACVCMLACLGTNQAWSVFVKPLTTEYGLSKFQTQLVFSTGTFFFCFMIIFGGRLHDRLGPRPLAVASACILGCAWYLASTRGSDFFFLWLGIGVLGGTGSGVGYVCPIATAVKWFPRHRGLVSGLMVAGFAGGPVLLSNLSEILLARHWHVLRIFGLVGSVYVPVIFVTGLLLVLPPGQPGHAEVVAFRRRKLFTDRRFWTLFAGMFTGTLPYLLVMGDVKPIGLDFGIGAAAVAAISVVAVGNACGRIFWGIIVDHIGTRRAMLRAQTLMIVSMLCLILLGRLHPVVFLAAAFGVGFCYGSNFAIYPASTAQFYGAHVLGSVYPLVMAAQGFSSFAPMLNGLLFDVTDSYLPGLSIAAGF
ncbi:MAG TPA: MFS transporter, partial [Planctomycetota bacterium]|nr:MFS transporter [Planctomycetota bacterium]